MKFTEEQYQEIINFDDFEVVYRLGLADSFVGEIITFINKNDLHAEAMALANPLTREWAHDKFVEKEKRYYWTGSKEDNVGFVKRLYKDDDGMIIDHGIRKEDTDKAEDEQLTESEIKAWGYNPDMFDREEV